MDDDALMQQVIAGDTQAFGQIVRRYQAQLLRFARRALSSPEQAQDVTQEAFLRLWRGRARYQSQGRLDRYLLRVVRHLCLDAMRSERPLDSLEDGAECIPSRYKALSAAVEAQQMAQEVARALHSLPPSQREVFILSHYEGLTYMEIAHLIGCPLGTVASRKAQAIAALRRKLHAWQEEENGM